MERAREKMVNMKKKMEANHKRYLRFRGMTMGVLASGVLLMNGCQAAPATTADTAATTVGAMTEAETGAMTETTTGAVSGAETGVVSEASGKAETEAAALATAETTTSQNAAALFGSFQSITLAGDEVTEEIFSQTGISMVNIWGTYCGPCVREMPDLAELSNEYRSENFQMLGIVVDAADAGNENAAAIVEQTGADYTHILISQDLIDGYLGKVQAVPTTVFVDSEGNQVGKTYMGAKTKEQWESIIKELLEETAAIE